MSLAFLSVSAGADGAVARSPMEPLQRAAGARFEIRDGWNVAVEYPAHASAASGPVAWADVSHLGKLELRGSAEAIDAVAGEQLSFGTAVRADGAWWCRLSSTRALVVVSGGGDALATVRERAAAAAGINVLDVTSSFAALTLVGPLARETFARFCALDLRPAVTPVRALRPGSIGRQPGVLIREDEERYLFLFGWATGEYMWSVVADAAGHLGGGPIGADALAALDAAGLEEAASA